MVDFRPFLSGSFPQGSSTLYDNSALLKCWDLVQRLSHNIWKQWSTSYLQTLRSGRMPLPTSKLETLLYLKMRSYLTFSRVVATNPDSDGLVWVVDVPCRKKTYNRPITRLVKMIFAETDAPLSLLPPREDIQAS